MLKRSREDEHDPDKLYLLPNEFRIDKLCNVRPFTSQLSESEDEALINLARSIEEIGQVDDVVITEGHIIISGHRRVKAFIIINERRSKNCRPLLRVRCRIDRDPGDLRRKAIQANLQRDNLTLMDQLYIILDMRRKHPEWRNVEPIADYLGISVSSVLNILKLNSASLPLQHQIHDGTISYSTALTVIQETEDPNLQAEIINKARTAQLETNTEKTIAQADAKKISRRKAMRKLIHMKDGLKIESPAVKQVIREMHLADRNGDLQPKTSPHTKRERAELLEDLATLIKSTLHPPHKHFLDHFVNIHAAGGGTVEELRKLWLVAIGLVS